MLCGIKEPGISKGLIERGAEEKTIRSPVVCGEAGEVRTSP